MSKRKETLALEEGLERIARKKRWYGCEEITIGFFNNGHGNEICDYILMDSKGILRCYELKVTKQDLKSDAKLSWYGNYNYLVVTEELYKKIINEGEDWQSYLPEGVGLMVGYTVTRFVTSTCQKEVIEYDTVIRPKKKNLSAEEQLFITQSMIRSMMYKIFKYKDSNNLDKMKELIHFANEYEKYYRQEKQENQKLLQIQSDFLRLLRKNTHLKFYPEDVYDLVDISLKK